MTTQQGEEQAMSELDSRAEILKNISNFRLKFLKHFDDPLALIRDYESGDVDLHLHATRRGFLESHNEREAVIGPDGFMACITVSHSPRALRNDLSGVDGKVLVLVKVRKGTEAFRPVHSYARLQLLERCRVFTGDPADIAIFALRSIAGFAPTLKSLTMALDRELGVILFAAGIPPGHFIDHVIETTPQGLNGLTHIDADLNRNSAGGWSEVVRHWSIEVEGSDHRLAFNVDQGSTSPCEIGQVFFYPCEPSISAFQVRHEVSSKRRVSLTDAEEARRAALADGSADGTSVNRTGP